MPKGEIFSPGEGNHAPQRSSELPDQPKLGNPLSQKASVVTYVAVRACAIGYAGGIATGLLCWWLA